MSVIIVRPLLQSFERLGLIREHLTALQTLAADLDDATVSQNIDQAMRANSAALTRVTQLKQLAETTESRDDDLDSQHAAGPRED